LALIKEIYMRNVSPLALKLIKEFEVTDGQTGGRMTPLFPLSTHWKNFHVMIFLNRIRKAYEMNIC